MNCQCNQEAKLLETKKPGPNQGRKFYVCSKPQGEQCDFFCWEGETPRGVSKRVATEPLQSKALAQIQAQLTRIEEGQKILVDMISSIGGRTRPEPTKNDKPLPF